ncbi:hypothetical protein ANANG_G00017850 [Anguilla anguilla]|uniref:Uncharacterized protein n=1 Tax=Anguilla anguilla TaxID=7936 RepID=A0A9D3N0W8_ANGAN|nr:hypothetical protein ANANG_G00017850 [Anguilla anguilla]
MYLKFSFILKSCPARPFVPFVPLLFCFFQSKVFCSCLFLEFEFFPLHIWVLTLHHTVTTVLCWSKSKYEEQKEILQHFLILREKGQVPTYITSEDMKDWVISDGQNILRERFQTDTSQQRDRLIHLVWEVNMRLKLQDICRDVGMSPSSSEAPLMHAQDTQRATLADLESAALEKAAAAESYSRWYFDAHFVVLVGDTVTGLLGAVMEPANRRAPSRAFSEVAVGGAICVRDDLRAAGWAEERAFGAQCWRWARPNMVGVLHRDLLEQTGSPGALQAALRGNSAAVTSAIAKALLAAADTALSAGPATPEEEKEEEEEENVPVAEDPVNTAVEPETPVAQDKTSVVDSEASTTSEEEMDSCMTSLEEIGSKMTADNSDAVMTSLEVDSCMTSQEDMDSPLTPQMESEAPMTSTVLTDVVMATLGGIPTTEEPLVEEGGKPDGVSTV